MNLLDYKQLSDNLIDWLCEVHGPNFVATNLIVMGYTNDHLLELGFEQDTIDQAKENAEKGIM